MRLEETERVGVGLKRRVLVGILYGSDELVVWRLRETAALVVAVCKKRGGDTLFRGSERVVNPRKHRAA